MKKILCVLLLTMVFVFVFASCSLLPFSQIHSTDAPPVDLAFFLKDDGTYAVEIGQAKYRSKIEIPATYKGIAVTEIGSFSSEFLKEITIPDSVTTISSSAFSGCNNITTATMPTTAISAIPKSNLTTVVITSGATIDPKAFHNCTSLMSVTICDSVTSIEFESFCNCTSLTSITIGDSVTKIGYDAFRNCTSLTSVTIPDSVTSIDKSAFRDCTSLTSVVFANPNGWWRSLTSISTSGDAFSAASLAKASTAAQYLRSTYHSYYWKRTK